MNIEITEEEIEEGKQLTDKYKECPQDGSYWQHLANWAIDLLINKGVIEDISSI